MGKTPFTPVAEDSTQTKVWITNELLAWLDSEAEKRERSRSFLLNEAIYHRRNTLEARRVRK